MADGEDLDITHTPGKGFHLEGFPDAVAYIRVTSQDGELASSLMLHRNDLELALACLEEINKSDGDTLREALWRTAVAQFFKCFQKSEARRKLDAPDVYGAEPPIALEVFDFFKNLRDKHLLHDENLFAECVTGAVVNPRDQPVKIAKVVSIALLAKTLDQESWNNMHMLVAGALQWTKREYESVCGRITGELEQRRYDELLASEPVTVRKPGNADAVGKRR